MESKDELKEIDMKLRTCYYLDDVMRYIAINFNNILLDKKMYHIKNTKIFLLMTFHMKPSWGQNHCVLDSIK